MSTVWLEEFDGKSGGQVRGTPKLDWMNGVKAVLWTAEKWWRLRGERYEGVTSPGAHVGDRVRRGYSCLLPVFFRTALPRSGGLSP